MSHDALAVGKGFNVICQLLIEQAAVGYDDNRLEICSLRAMARTASIVCGVAFINLKASQVMELDLPDPAEC